MKYDLENNDDEIDNFIMPSNLIQTTNTGDVPIEVNEKVKYGFKFSGCNILNNIGSLLSRKLHEIKGSRYVNCNFQKICSVAKCKSIPLLYPEGMIFPSLHWKSAKDDCSIAGAIPSSLLNEFMSKEGFAPIQQHVRTRLTSPSNAMNSDPRYISHCYDVMANMAATHNDTRLVINRGLTVGEDKYGSLEVRGNSDSTILGSVDSKQMVKNLCTSQKYIKWSYFLTYTSNHKRHFGTKTIKEWLDQKGWKDTYPNYMNLSTVDQEEIDNSFNQASIGLILRVWEEVSKLFLDFIQNSPHSPFKLLKAIFGRREYQSESGNVAHSHIILAIDWPNNVVFWYCQTSISGLRMAAMSSAGFACIVQNTTNNDDALGKVLCMVRMSNYG